MDFFSFDDDYVRRLREGDRETVDHFEKYFRDLLFAQIRRRIASRETAEDRVQEVLIRVWTKLDELKDGRKLGGFVQGFCKHVLQEWQREPEQTRTFTSLDIETPISTPDPLWSLIDAETKARVRRVLQRLPWRDAAIISAIFFEEADLDEVCDRLGVERPYLRVLLHRALKRFRSEFRKDSDPP